MRAEYLWWACLFVCVSVSKHIYRNHKSSLLPNFGKKVTIIMFTVRTNGKYVTPLCYSQCAEKPHFRSVSLKHDGPTGQTTGQRGWPVGVAAGQLELTGQQGRRRAWQIGRFELTCSLALTLTYFLCLIFILTVMVAVLVLYFEMTV